MAHYANIVNGKVENVIVADAIIIHSLPGTWVQTSYNTKGGVHYGPDGTPDGGIPLRKNFASIGFTYDERRDAFIPPKPFKSWILNEQTCLWDPPIPYPDINKAYVWDEDIKNWVEVQRGT